LGIVLHHQEKHLYGAKQQQHVDVDWHCLAVFGVSWRCLAF